MSEQMKSSCTNSRHVGEEEKPVYNCPYCSKVFRDPSSWSLHKKLHTSTELFRCQLCSYTCRVKKYLARHMKYHRPPTKYTCEICGKAFHFRCKMESHMRVHTKEKPFVCAVCDKAFSSSYTLSGHMLTHTDQKPFQCSFCEYACRDSSTLRKHVERHIGASKVYECQICNKSYKCKWQLKTHLEEKHFGVEPQRYPCQLCDKLFKSKYNVDKHIKSVHEKSLSCECDVCGHVISNKSNLVQHMKRHVDVSPYKCTFTNCGRRFKDKGDLRRHLITHSPARQHACGACGRLFARRRRLARHAQQHIAHAARARTAECPHCGVLFYSKNYLLLHIKKKHDRKRNKFICDLCDFTTSNKPSLVMHLKYRHCARGDIKCQICNKEYKKFECLKRHYLNSHNVLYNTLIKEPESTSVEVKEEPDDEEVVEYHPEIDLLEIHKEELIEPEYSDPIIYSETVLSEDVSRSIMQRDKRRLGEPENEFDSLFIDHIIENPDKTVVKFDKCKEEGRGVNSRESSVEIDVEKLDKYEDGQDASSVEESDDSLEESDNYCLEDPGINSIENSGENILENFVKPVKIFVEKLDQNTIENAVKMNARKLGSNIAKKSAKVTVEKLDIDNLRNNSVKKISVSKPKKNNTKYNSLIKNKNLKVCVEKLDVNRYKKLRKIGMRKMNKNTVKKIRVKQSDRSYVVNINKNDLARRNSIKRRKKRGVKPVKDLYIKHNKSVESTPEPDITDYSKSVFSEDISRCLQERVGRVPGEPENRLESIFIDHYMEKADNNPSSEQEWEVSAYSRRVLSEDVSRSVMRRDRRVAGDPQADIDRLFIDHVMEKPDKHSVELVKQNIDTQKEKYVKKCVEKMLQRSRAKSEAAVLEETRRKYNERINELSTKSNKKDHVNIKYFKNKSTEAVNDNIDTGDDGNDEEIDDQIVQIDAGDVINDENDARIDDETEDNYNNDTNDEQIVQNNGITDDQIADNDNTDTKDDEQISDDEGIKRKNNKINFNTHQCYICFELFKTKSDLTHHCKEHFQICNLKMLKKCPYCGYVTNFDMKRHLKLKHDVKVDLFNAQITETHDEEGSKYYLQTQQCKLEVIPSINNLNRKAYMKIDEMNRLNKNTEITTAKIVKNGTEWVVAKDILRITNEFQLPEFSTEEYMSLNISGDKYEDMLKKLSFLAKKRGLKMLFPCNECDKVCRKMSGLVLHNRVHEANPKPFKRKVWKGKALKHRNVNKHEQRNRVKVITRVRHSENYKEFVENQIKRSRMKTLHVEDIAGTTSNVASDEKLSVNNGRLAENRFAEPKPIEHNHKCDKELMEFYKSNIKGGDVEFWQFLKIFNKMSRENVNDFDDLESRTDFGIHINDATVSGNTENENNVNSDNGNIKSGNSEEGGNTSSEIEIDSNIGKMKMNKNVCKRVLMISKRERQRREAIKHELRKRIECDNVEA